MKVLMTGATGFIGRALLDQLVGRGNEVNVLSRSAERAKASLPGIAAAFAWNPICEKPPVEALQGVDTVIHLAGEPVAARRWTPAQKKAIHDSRVLGTRHLVQAMNEMGIGGPKTLLAASAIGLYGERGEEPLTESSPRGQGFLSDVVADWEAASLEADARTVLVRIGMVLGNGGALEKLVPLFRIGAGGPVGNGKQWVPWIHIDDLVELFLFAMKQPDWKGPYNGTGPSPVRNQELSETLARVLRRPCLLRAPAFGLRLVLGEMAELVLTSQRVLPERSVRQGFTFRFPGLEGALTDLLSAGSRSPS